jgi:hypothetical protein
MCAHKYTCIHTYSHMCTGTHIHRHPYMCTYIHKKVNKRTHLYACMCRHYTYKCIHSTLCIHADMCLYTHNYTNTNVHKIHNKHKNNRYTCTHIRTWMPAYIHHTEYSKNPGELSNKRIKLPREAKTHVPRNPFPFHTLRSKG